MPASNCEQQLINQAQLIGGQLYGLGRRQPIGKGRVDYVVCQNYRRLLHLDQRAYSIRGLTDVIRA